MKFLVTICAFALIASCMGDTKPLENRSKRDLQNLVYTASGGAPTVFETGHTRVPYTIQGSSGRIILSTGKAAPGSYYVPFSIGVEGPAGSLFYSDEGNVFNKKLSDQAPRQLAGDWHYPVTILLKDGAGEQYLDNREHMSRRSKRDLQNLVYTASGGEPTVFETGHTRVPYTIEGASGRIILSTGKAAPGSTYVPFSIGVEGPAGSLFYSDEGNVFNKKLSDQAPRQLAGDWYYPVTILLKDGAGEQYLDNREHMNRHS